MATGGKRKKDISFTYDNAATEVLALLNEDENRVEASPDVASLAKRRYEALLRKAGVSGIA
jgi:hypothetical protein